MKLNSTALALLASAAACSAMNVGAPPNAPAPKAGKRAELDVGQRAVMKAVFDSADQIKDNAVNLKEFESAFLDLQRRMLTVLNPKRNNLKPNPPTKGQLAKLFAKVDANHNAAVSIDEFQTAYPNLKVAILWLNIWDAYGIDRSSLPNNI